MFSAKCDIFSVNEPNCSCDIKSCNLFNRIIHRGTCQTCVTNKKHNIEKIWKSLTNFRKRPILRTLVVLLCLLCELVALINVHNRKELDFSDEKVY